MGRATRVTIPGSGRSYAAHYEVVEHDSLNASHSGINFQPNPKYNLTNERDYTKHDNQSKILNWAMAHQFKPRELINDSPGARSGPSLFVNDDALGGNGRHMIMDRVLATNPKGTKAYRDLLNQEAAHYGIDPAAFSGMKNPQLIRRIDPSELQSPADLQRAISDFNVKGTAALPPSEQAIADSRRVSQGTLDDIAQRLDAAGPGGSLPQILTGRSGTEVLNKLIDDGVISVQDRAQYASGDDLLHYGEQKAKLERCPS